MWLRLETNNSKHDSETLQLLDSHHRRQHQLPGCNKILVCVSLLPTLAELDAEHAQKVVEMEHAQQAKLKERQKYFEEAFQQDMEQYLSTGYLQISDRRGEAFVCVIAALSVV